MVDPLTGDGRFFVGSGPYALATVAAAAGGEAAHGALMLEGIAPLQTATPTQVSFLDNRRYLPLLDASKAGAVIIHPGLAAKVPPGMVAIATPEPYLGWARVAALFHPEPPPTPGIHPSAVVDADAILAPDVQVGPLAVIGARARIGPGCRIDALAVIGAGVEMGPGCRIGTHVSLSHAILGARVRLFPGARVGQDGFGFATTKTGFVSVPQLGRVVIDDDVEIGANTTIDRGSAQDTVIGAGSRLDNLVQIGHNVRLGRCCVIVAQVGISGSTILGDFVMIGGQAGLTGHLHIGDHARIGAQAGVFTDVDKGVEMVGSPAETKRAFFRQIAFLRRATRPSSTTSGEKDAG